MGVRKKKGTKTFNVAEAKARFSSLVRQALAGEDIVISKDHKPLIKLVPLAQPSRPRKPGSARGRVRLAPDFDRPLSDFKDYT